MAKKHAPRWPADNSENILRIRPKEKADFLLNPHKGCTTYRCVSGEFVTRETGDVFHKRTDLDFDTHYLPSAVAYFRWYWREFQPEPNRFDWSIVDAAMERAAAHGQTLEVRLMPHAADPKGDLPQWYLDRYPTRPGTYKPQPYTAAVYDGPEYYEQWGNVIREFGARYDGHPNLESVDISFIGPWGEGAGDCSWEGINRMIDVYRAAHPKTPLVAMLKHKRSDGRKGEGWRVDGMGDLGIYPGPEIPGYEAWNHMYDWYPRMIHERGAADVWKLGPVAFESIVTPQGWYEQGWDIDFIIQQHLKYHGTLFMPKSQPLPVAWREKLLKMCNDMGYRFVLRQYSGQRKLPRGQAMPITCWIENVGVAPIYHEYQFALRFAQGDKTFIYRSSADPRNWIPGDAWLSESVTFPEGFQPGRVEISAALIQPTTGRARVRLANHGLQDDGWLALGAMEIV